MIIVNGEAVGSGVPPRGSAPAPAAPVKRGPGRPRKDTTAPKAKAAPPAPTPPEPPTEPEPPAPSPEAEPKASTSAKEQKP